MAWEIGALTTDGPDVINQQFSDGPFPGTTGYEVGNAAGAEGWEPVCMTVIPGGNNTFTTLFKRPL